MQAEQEFAGALARRDQRVAQHDVGCRRDEGQDGVERPPSDCARQRDARIHRGRAKPLSKIDLRVRRRDRGHQPRDQRQVDHRERRGHHADEDERRASRHCPISAGLWDDDRLRLGGQKIP